MPEFFGLCGRHTVRPCKLSWASDYNLRVGSYPSDFLPSSRTIWHATAQGGYSFHPPVISPGDSFGLPLLGFFTSTGSLSLQFDNFQPSTRVVFSFCRIANRLNVAHVLTEAEINSANLQDPTSSGIAEINVGEYVFEAICVTDQQEAINQTLTPEEITQIENQESTADRLFRKLFEQNIPEGRNRLIGVKVNKQGIEYRLDNGDSKAISALDSTGTGTFVNENSSQSYRDGSSKILLIDVKKLTDRVQTNDSSNTLQGQRRQPKAGDIIYLSYVAVTQHYIRQSVNVKWSINALSLPPQCFAYPTSIKVASFRFFDWTLVDNTILSGWRCVETDNVPVNIMSVFNSQNRILGEVPIGGSVNNASYQYIPLSTNINQLNNYIANRSLLPVFSYSSNQSTESCPFLQDKGVNDSRFAYQNSDWYKRNNFTTFDSCIDVNQKILFNTHPNSMKKRDVDKFGIEYSLAAQIQQDINSGKNPFVPFLDGSDLFTSGSSSYLTNSNFSINPIQPLTKWSLGNLEVECAVGGGIALGFNSGFNGFGDVLGVFGIISPIISERFEKDTKILVEFFATEGEFGPNIIAIEGSSTSFNCVSCIDSLDQTNHFVFHFDEQNFIKFNTFKIGNIEESLINLSYRPDLSIDTNQKYLGYNLLIGDNPSYSNGLSVESSFYLTDTNFKYFTNSIEKLSIEKNNITDINFINFSKTNTEIKIEVEAGFYGNLYIEYEYLGITSNEILIKLNSGEFLVCAIDSIAFNPGNLILDLNFKWQKIDSILITGNNFEKLNIKFFYITKLKDEIAKDFLFQVNSVNNNNKLFSAPVLYKSNVFSVSQDDKGGLFVFFNDDAGGISCANSNDNGISWIVYYGIVEKIDNYNSINPFAVSAKEQNSVLLFYEFNKKILCKLIPFELFKQQDSFIVERYIDRVSIDNSTKTERLGLFSDSGRSLRRDVISYVAAGDLSDTAFLNLFGKHPSEPEDSFFEPIRLETLPGVFVDISKSKNPIRIGSATGLVNQDINDPYFSAYKKDNGQLFLFFMGQTENGYELQCNYSVNNGLSWYYYWEYIEFSTNRLKIDQNKRTEFIGSLGGYDFQTDNLPSNQTYYFGLNVHWSRLKTHKTDPSLGLESDSQIMSISAPYIYYHPFMAYLFIFYIYKGCLLCKIVNENIFDIGIGSRSSNITGLKGFSLVKDVIERRTRSHFVDGFLNNSELLEEINFYVNQETKERQVEGNIIYPYVGSLNNFNSDRKIENQRICAYRFSDCNIRVFYKIQGKLKSSIWNGSYFACDDFFKYNATEYSNTISTTNVTDVTGGFGVNKF